MILYGFMLDKPFFKKTISVRKNISLKQNLNTNTNINTWYLIRAF